RPHLLRNMFTSRLLCSTYLIALGYALTRKLSASKRRPFAMVPRASGEAFFLCLGPATARVRFQPYTSAFTLFLLSMLDIIFPFAGGLGLFLIGMMLLSEGLVAFAGGTLQKTLLAITGRPIKAFASGALITALAQSSTATTVTLIGFVSAGLISFSQAIGVVIGASFGNTATGWIVAGLGLKINLGFYTLPLIGLGALLKLLGKGRG